MSNALKKQHQRPEGVLLEQAMKRKKISGRQLADMIKLSEGRVRQIINGYRTEAGQVIPIIGPADTVARLADGLGVAAKDMRDAGRDDVADEMSPLRSIGIGEDGSLWIADNQERLSLLRVWLDEAETTDPNLSPPAEALALWDFEQLMAAAVAAHQDEIRLKDYFIEMFGQGETSSPGLAEPKPTEGGDGHDGSDRAAPIGGDKEALSEVDDTLPSAAKTQGIQGSGEEGSI